LFLFFEGKNIPPFFEVKNIPTAEFRMISAETALAGT
jgi:hypothetical protein